MFTNTFPLKPTINKEEEQTKDKEMAG